VIVCFGGGKGLSATVRALLLKGLDFSAVVGTTDNGGSTGKLREEFGIPAIGDFRRVVDSFGGPLSSTMESRYGGHAIGNLVILDLVRRLGFRKGLEEYRKAMGVHHMVVPQFLEPCDVVAIVSGGKVVGETQIDGSKGKVEKIWLEPELPVNPEVLTLVEDADAMVLGPGSLFTSLMPHLLPAGFVTKLSRIPVKVLVTSIRNDLPVVEGFKLSDYLENVERFVKFDYVLAQKPGEVRVDLKDERVVLRDMSLDGHLHDPKKLGDALCELLK